MSSAYPDTSFLLSLYTPRPSSAIAGEIFAAIEDPITVTNFLLYEFENAARQAAWLHSRDKHKGFPTLVAQTAIACLEADIDEGSVEIAPCDFESVIETARRISNSRTWREGYRAFDLFHVATSRHLKIKRFLTFDIAQRRLAESEGLEVGP